MHPPDQSAHAVALNTFCPVEQEKLEALVMLLNELLPLVSIPTKEHLQGVIVVPDDQREALINELTKELDELAGAYVAGIHSRASTLRLKYFCGRIGGKRRKRKRRRDAKRAKTSGVDIKRARTQRPRGAYAAT